MSLGFFLIFLNIFETKKQLKKPADVKALIFSEEN